MHSIVRRKITYGAWRSNVDVDGTAKCNDSLFRLSLSPDLSYAADDFLFVNSLTRGIVVPAKHPHIRAAFSLCSKEASLLKPVHSISFAYYFGRDECGPLFSDNARNIESNSAINTNKTAVISAL
jgi:hypothetical protein